MAFLCKQIVTLLYPNKYSSLRIPISRCETFVKQFFQWIHLWGVVDLFEIN